MQHTTRLSAAPRDVLVLAALAGVLFPTMYGTHPGDGARRWIAALIAAAAGLALVPAAARLAPGRVDVLGLVLALASAGAATIHFAVFDQHLDEYWLFGVFFALSGLAQLTFAALVLARPSTLLYAAGALGNAAIIVLWIVSRTAGLPLGPDAGTAEAVGVPDVVATVLEALLVVGCTASLARPLGRRAGRSGLAVLLAAAFAPTAAALADASAPHGHTGGDHAHHAALPAVPAVLRGDRSRTLMLAQQTGDTLVGIAARAGGPVDVVAIPPDVSGLSPGSVTARVGNAPQAAAKRCGWNCTRFSYRVMRGAATTIAVRVELAGGEVRRTTFSLPARMPPPADRLYRRVQKRMLNLRSVRIDETLGPLRVAFELRAPDRMRYRSSDGSAAVVIGSRRWDLVKGSWRRSATQPLSLPAFIWDGAGRPRLLGRGRVGGRPVRVLSLYHANGQFPAWFRLYVTPSLHVVRAEMLAPAHAMVDRLSGFGAPLQITPPR